MKISFASMSIVLGSSLLALASPAAAAPNADALFAQERAAEGGAVWDHVAEIEERGTAVSGGAPSTFQAVVDRRNGYDKIVVESGPFRDTSGFDGMPWDSQNGSLITITLPGLVSDAATTQYVNRDGWWQRGGAVMRYLGEKTDGTLDADVVNVVPTDGSGVDVWLDRTSHLIVRTVAHTDAGDVTQTNDDFRTVEGARISFHNVSVDATGAKTETTFSEVKLLTALDPAATARPQVSKRGSFTGPAPAVVAFRFDAVDGGHIVMPAQFGHSTLSVIFDSGGQNLLTPAAAKTLNLTTGGGGEFSGVGNESVAGSFANVGTVDASTAELSDQAAIVLALPYSVVHPAAGLDVQGLIGSEMLSNFKTTVDYAARTIAFAPFDASASQSPQTVPFYTDGAHAYIPASIDGVSGYFGIDTGDGGGLTVFRQFAAQQGLFTSEGIPFVSGGGVGGHIPGATYRAKTLTIGATTLQAPIVQVTQAAAGAFASKSIAGNIGARILARFTVTFDYAHSTMTFVPNAHAADPFLGDRTGISLDQTQPGYFSILSVAPNSPGAEAGLKPGDHIVAIGGKDVASAGLGGGDLRGMVMNPSTTELQLVVQRGDERQSVTLKLRQMV